MTQPASQSPYRKLLLESDFLKLTRRGGQLIATLFAQLRANEQTTQQVTALPNPTADLRGKIYMVNAGGATDTAYVCRKTTTGYDWVRVDAARLLHIPLPGAAVVAAGKLRYRFPVPVTILTVAVTANTAPVGAALTLDTNKNGTTIFTTQANRPSIPASSRVSSDATPDVTSFAAGDYLTVDIDQIGSTTAGSDLVVAVRYREA